MRFPLPILLIAAVLPGAFALAAGVTTISQNGRAFALRAVQLAPGDSVRFMNNDDFIHQVYVEASSFSYESAEQEPGQAVNVRFPTTGTFEVRCHIHPKMLLTVTVR